MSTHKQPVAVFDIDGTLFRSSLLVELVSTLIEQEIFPASCKEEYAREYQQWQDREGTYDAYISAVVSVFETHIRGVSYADFKTCADIVVSQQRSHIYTFTRDLVTQLSDRGYYLLAISQSPKGIIDPFCDAFGFDKVYGRLYETGANHCFTGNIVDEHLIANKANIVKRAAQREHLDLTQSVGVGDTDGDIPLLELTTEKICFNPNNRLYTHAKRMGWNIVVERKDVVYGIQQQRNAGIVSIDMLLSQ